MLGKILAATLILTGMARPATAAAVHRFAVDLKVDGLVCHHENFVASCVEIVMLDPAQVVTPRVGDKLILRVTPDARMLVPSSPYSNWAQMALFTAESKAGDIQPGPYGLSSTFNFIGYSGPSMQPFGTAAIGAYALTNTAAYVGISGYSAKWGPTGDRAFSFSAEEVSGDVTGAGPLAIVGVSLGYTVYVEGPPQTVSTVAGGPPDHPAALPAQEIDQISGAIGPGVGGRYFAFKWERGFFQAVGQVTGGEGAWLYRIYNDKGEAVKSQALDASNGFRATLQGPLPNGKYAIGIEGQGASPATLRILFNMPIVGRAR